MPPSSLPTYAFFDFDGTMICQDSFLFLLKQGFIQNPGRLLWLVVLSPLFFFSWVFFKDKAFAKSLLLWSLTVGRGKRQTVVWMHKIMKKQEDRLFFQEIKPCLENLKQQGIQPIVVTASGQAWVRALLRSQGLTFKVVIGSRLGFWAGGLVFISKNCYNTEKISRIKEFIKDPFVWHSSWSDHPADLPLLNQANLKYIISPKPMHKVEFEKALQGDYFLLNWTSCL
jgi:phosphatidylglycerophosphatase C